MNKPLAKAKGFLAQIELKHNFYAMVTEVHSNGAVTRPDCGPVSWDELYKDKGLGVTVLQETIVVD